MLHESATMQLSLKLLNSNPVRPLCTQSKVREACMSDVPYAKTSANFEGALSLLGRREGRSDGKVGGRPGDHASGNFTDAVKSMFLQKARRNRRTVTARAVDQQRAVFGDLFQVFLQMIERET